MLDPQAQALLQFLAASGMPPIYTVPPVKAREGYRMRRTATQPDPVEVRQVRDHTVACVPGNGEMSFQVREYQPLGQPHGKPLPALVYVHGGGFTIGDLDTHDVLCRSLCQLAGVVVVSVDYRLAPEHPFPAAYDDTVAAFRWAVAQAEMLGIDPQRIAIGGDSAGGNLAAAASLALRGQVPAPAYQLLIYPATDQRRTAASHTTNGIGYLLDKPTVDWFIHNYVPHSSDHTDWRASPLLAASLAGAPPALVLTAGFDPLRDEGLQYADALSAAGVATEYICFERQIHGFITMGRVLREAHTAVMLCADALKRALA